MPKWKVELEERRYIEVIVEADDWQSARDAADATEFVPLDEHPLDRYAQPIIQYGEPWLRWIDWYDLHAPGDIICAETAYGNDFTQADIDILRSRINSIPGLKVVDDWNGAGTNSVSFRVKGRVRGNAPLTKEQIEMLRSKRE